MLEEQSHLWINIHDMIHYLPLGWTDNNNSSNNSNSNNNNNNDSDNIHFIWASEKSGFSQLYFIKFNKTTNETVYLLEGCPIGGGGDWVVER